MAFPPSIDWVEKGAVTSVKSQKCGNCWTFSAAGSLEGAYQIATKTLTNFSEQEFVDCCESWETSSVFG
jgi:C1A family cysteine protease